ncbi:MAG: hypothetical protein IT376_00125 [Polyangiaceae bacterium]|nr:hypothetical protein [Polyangiaceae bacterium]
MLPPRLALLLAPVALLACSANDAASGSGFGGGASSGSGAQGGFGGVGAGGGSGGGLITEAGLPSCDTGQFVFLMTSDRQLLRFDPPALTFSVIGVLDCPATFSPYSMAVDRGGTAWVHGQLGGLARVDTTNAHCTTTNFAPNQQGFSNFGMGFATDALGSSAETLYVSGVTASGDARLGRIDLGSLALVPIGAYDSLAGRRAELTGTGDARLFGAFEGQPYVVAEIERASAHIASQVPAQGVTSPPSGSNFAFAFWGGDFWLFVGPGSGTTVHRHRPSDSTTAPMVSTPYTVVGAGVSTCAPLVPPS